MADSDYAVRTAEQLSVALAGRYVVEKEIGAGGMATVYLARDIKHNRRVALKVLKPDLGAALGPERFLAEIQVTANLQHPNLLPLFDSGEVKSAGADGGSLLFYVMPFVEGQTLRDRLKRETQLPVDEAVRIAIAIAGALDYAHRHGVVHRDLKPENILLHEEQPVVMDFGIALAVSNAGGERLTQMGLSLGTPHYMSPEQATGDRALDARSDIYSLGAVLYEMLTGAPPHGLGSAQAVIARVIMDKPASVRLKRETVPPHVDAAIAQALAKLPADRFATAAEFARALGDDHAVAPHASPSAPYPMILAPPATTTAIGRVLARPAARAAVVGTSWTVFLGAAAAAGAAVVFALTNTAEPTFARFPITVPDTVAMPGTGRAIALSPDGSRLAIAASVSGRPSRLHARPMTGVAFVSLHGTDGATSPSFSPSGDWLLFAADGRLKKVPADGGSALPLADASDGQHSWSDRDEILYASGGALWVVAAGGGTPRLVARPDSAKGERAYGWPDFLPGGEHALITIARLDGPTADSSRIGVVEIADGKVTDLGIVGTGARFAAPGHIVFATAGGTMWAAPFNARRRVLRGDKRVIADGVHVDSTGATDVVVSRNGTLIFGERAGSSGGGQARAAIVIVDAEGAAKVTSAQRGDFISPRVSPDASRIALTVREGPRADVWIFEIATGILSALTRDGISHFPEWADARRIVLRENSVNPGRFMIRPWDNSAAAVPYFAPTPVQGGGGAFSLSLGPASGFLAYVRVRAGTQSFRRQDIFMAPMGNVDSSVTLLDSPARELTPRISPNGRWIAYSSDESGKFQLYVQPVPGPGARVPVSVEHGIEPVWSRDGRKLYYVSNGHLLAATVDERSGFQATVQDTVFSFTEKNWLVRPPGRGPSQGFYDVFPNGDFVVFARAAEMDATRSGMVVMLHWQQVLTASASREDP
jgi:Tol biopolymer transport system component